MPLQRLRRALLVAASSALLLAACGGGGDVVSQLSPSRVVAFGDAFSDVGQRGTRYTINDGSVNNWSQQVAQRYGRPLTAASAGGLSYATGNARVTARPDAAGDAGTPSVADQVGTFLAGQRFEGNDLVLLNGGISDIVAQVAAVNAGTQTTAQAGANVRQAGRELAAQARRVVQAGARYVVVVGSYNLGRTPWAAATNQAALLTDLSSRFNDELLTSMVDLGANVLYVDAALYFNLVTSSPSGYGLRDVTSIACNSTDPGAGIGTGAGQVNSARCTPATLQPGVDPGATLFADRLYFTPRGHVQFGDYAYDRVRQRF